MLVLTHGRRRSPSFTAFRATRPAPIMTEGLDVLVQLVMAAITTERSFTPNRLPSYSTAARAAISVDATVAVCGDCPPSLAQREPFFSCMPLRLAAVGTR